MEKKWRESVAIFTSKINIFPPHIINHYDISLRSKTFAVIFHPRSPKKQKNTNFRLKVNNLKNKNSSFVFVKMFLNKTQKVFSGRK
jgi:hypothetical protein